MPARDTYKRHKKTRAATIEATTEKKPSNKIITRIKIISFFFSLLQCYNFLFIVTICTQRMSRTWFCADKPKIKKKMHEGYLKTCLRQIKPTLAYWNTEKRWRIINHQANEQEKINAERVKNSENEHFSNTISKNSSIRKLKTSFLTRHIIWRHT